MRTGEIIVVCDNCQARITETPANPMITISIGVYMDYLYSGRHLDFCRPCATEYGFYDPSRPERIDQIATSVSTLPKILQRIRKLYRAASPDDPKNWARRCE